MKIMNIDKDPYVYVEFKVRKKSGRSWIITPDGSEPVFEKVRADNTILRALAKAHLWQRDLNKCRFASIRELAAKRNVGESYVRRILNLNYLSPKIKQLAIDGRLPKHLKLQDIITDVSLSWNEQETRWLG